MPDTYVCSGWACTDCLVLLANGEDPADTMTQLEINDWHREIDRRNAGYEITLGMLREDHSCQDENGNTASDNGDECNCEVKTFSWSACHVCGSNLGGERHAVSWFKL